MLPVSILDLSPVTTATPAARALHNSVDLARHADPLGFTRYWLAEHHGLPAIASSAPDVMIARIAAETAHMRVGSGGIMLPNHAPLTVAETFRTLEALHPGRIDLGIGRAPGSDQTAAFALRRRMEGNPDEDFLARLQELIAFGNDLFPDGHPFRSILTQPADTVLPPIWLLGSSDFGGRAAAALGHGFAFAHHFASFDAGAAIGGYKSAFRPSEWLAEPHAILGVAAIVAPSQEEADYLAASFDLMQLRRARGELAPLASPEEALARDYDTAERAIIQRARARLFAGTPDTVRAMLTELAAQVGADELMVTTMVFDHAARKRSYSLLAEAFALQGAGTPA